MPVTRIDAGSRDDEVGLRLVKKRPNPKRGEKVETVKGNNAFPKETPFSVLKEGIHVGLWKWDGIWS